MEERYLDLVNHCKVIPAVNQVETHVFASFDPVALDQACMDLIYQADGSENFIAQIERLNAPRTLEHGEEIDLGSRTYRLVSIDE